MYCCYIIYSVKLDRYYIGHTENMDQRLLQHNSGISTFTAKANDWILKWEKEFGSREEARACEAALKKKKSRSYLEWLIGGGVM